MPANDYIFDGVNKRIIMANTSSLVEIKDTYSRWKQWVIESDNAKFLQAFRSVGGDPITDTKSLGTTYFLINGWRIQPFTASYTLDIEGNLYAEEVSGSETTTVDPIAPVTGSYNVLVRLNVSNLVDAEVLQSEFEQILEYNGEIIYDPVNGVSGSTYPVGTPGSPLGNEGQLSDLLLNVPVRVVKLLGDINLQDTYNAIRFQGNHKDIDVQLNPTYTYNNVEFRNVVITGTSGGGSLHISDSIVNGLQNIIGFVGTSGLTGSMSLGNGQVTMHDCFSIVPGNGSPIIDASGSDSGLNIRSYSGGIRFANITSPSFLATVEFIAGRFNIDGSNTDGFVSLRGVAYVNDTGAMTFMETGSLVNIAEIRRLQTPILEKVREVHELHGLDSTKPLTVTQTARTFGDVSQSINTTGTGSLQKTVITRT